MWYVDSTPSGFSSSEKKYAYKAALDEGVCYGEDSASSADVKASEIKNMWLKNGVLTGRKQLSDLGFAFDGTGVHSSIFCFGHEIIHGGSSLYGINGDGCTEMKSGLPDKNSFFAEFSGKLYFYCDKAVYIIGEDLSVTEIIPYCPVYSTSCIKGSGHASKSADFVPNILAPSCRVYYGESVADTDYKFCFPDIMDMTRIFEVYIKDELLDKSLYTYDDRAFYLTKELYPGENKLVSVHFFGKGDDFKDCGIITGCSASAVYGGNTSDGTMVIAAGNPEYPGRYFFSELANPLSFKADMYGVAGDGSESITAFSKQHSDLIVFTAGSVNRMRYNYSSETGGYFSVHMINSDIGCDVSESVASVDNRTVFANSKRGVFIVDSTDNFDFMNIMRISGNITDSDRKKGYFAIDDLDRKKGYAAVYDGKYMLLCGDSVFIWDYGNSPYVSSADYIKAEKKLTWFEFDGFSGSEMIFYVSDELYAVKKTKDGVLSLYGLKDEGEKCLYVYKSGNSGLSYPFDDKYVTGFTLGIKCAKGADIGLNFFADGRRYYSAKAFVRPESDGCAVYSVRLPKCSCKRFAFEITGEYAGLGFTGVSFNYMIRKNMRNIIR